MPSDERWPQEPVRISTGTAQVVQTADDPDGVTLLVNGVPSSHLDLADPTRLEFEYMQQMTAVLDAFRPPPAPLAVVHLGAGACALARAVHAARPGSRQLAVELDGQLAALVRTWFDLPRSPALRIRVGDARTELGRLPDASADVVVRDVFAGDQTPDPLTTAELTADVSRVLRPGGLYLANCADRPPLTLARSEVATVASVFAHVAAVAEPAQLKGRRYGNVVIAATDSPAVLDSPALGRALRSLPVPAHVLHGAELSSFASRAPVRHDVDEAPRP